MRWTIDQVILDKHGLSIGEFLVLYISSKGESIKECVESILAKGLANKDLFSEGALIISDKTKELVSSILVDSDKRVVDKVEEFSELAKEIRELYPKGRKEGTTYMWRDSVTEIARRLKILVTKYQATFTKEQVLNATKRYVQSFNGNYTRMRLLKYFIFKTDRDADGNTTFTSELMSLIENEDTEVVTKDWTTILI